MANIQGSYDENAEASADFAPIPASTYRAKIVESEVEDISKTQNKGRCLKLVWQIETGAYDGRLVWQRLNMWPENMNNMDKVTQIANSQFASIRQAVGKSTPKESSELHQIPCEIYVGLTKPQQGYAQQNEVKSVKAVTGGAPTQRSAPPAGNGGPRPAPAANGGGSAPWRKAG